MTVQNTVSELLSSQSEYQNNFDLLKKIILTTYLGRLRINGLAPDDEVTLGNYLFDEERIIFDYTRLSDSQKKKFDDWFLKPHQADKGVSDTSGVTVNEYRGFTAEVALNWWGRIKKFFGYSDTDHWKLKQTTLTLEYQLNGIDMCHGRTGTLIGFDQFGAPSTEGKYDDPRNARISTLGNTKRVFITDKLVDQLVSSDMSADTIKQYCESPHPQAMKVVDVETRYKDMFNNRNILKFEVSKPWYLRLWDWFLSFFPKEEVPPVNNAVEVLLEEDNVTIYQREESEEIIVIEKKPEIQNLVLCGGGPKIFGHVGVWRALNEAQIRPTHFAGTSAGAVMSLLCYLGYTADEISDLFRDLQQEHIVYIEFNIKGASDSKSFKTAIDYMVAKKLKEVTSKYDIPYPQGPITFAKLEHIRQQCLQKNIDCGFGEELVITTTKTSDGSTEYFSLARKPDFEVTEAVAVSSSVPLMFRPQIIENEEHTDGGMSSNFPTEVFSDDYSTFLESEHGNNLGLLAVQFDTGTERDTIDKMDDVYREGTLMRFLYRILSGVSDPASAWEQDRLKLRKYAAQSIIVALDEVPASFAVSNEIKVNMGASGYKAAKDYLDARFSKDEEGNYKHEELMYSTFSSLGDLLAYCCYRGELEWFNKVNDLIAASNVPNKFSLMQKSNELRALYFSAAETVSEVVIPNANATTFFGNPITQVEEVQYPDILLTIYPMFLKLSPDMVKGRHDHNKFDRARHAVKIQSPFGCLQKFAKIQEESHIVLQAVINAIRELKDNPTPEVYERIKQITQFLNTNEQDIIKPEFFGKWDLSSRQYSRVLKALTDGKFFDAALLCSIMKEESGAEPLQSIDEDNLFIDFQDGQDQPCVYPILLNLCSNLLKDNAEKSRIEFLCKSKEPTSFPDFFPKNTADTYYILLSSIINVIKELEANPSKELSSTFNNFMNFFYTNKQSLSRPEFYDQWNLSTAQSIRVMKLFTKGKLDDAAKLSLVLSNEEAEPLQVINDGDFYEDHTTGEETGLSP